jgi:hypothetical protein
MRQLEVSMLGGWTERRMRRRRGGIDELPWNTIDPALFAAADVELARSMWTNGIFTEYASATAFSQLATAPSSGAPVDLTAACADIVVDEMTHVEIVTRVVSSSAAPSRTRWISTASRSYPPTRPHRR